MNSKLTKVLIAFALVTLFVAASSYAAATTICYRGSVTSVHGTCGPQTYNSTGYTLSDCQNSQSALINLLNNSGHTIISVNSCTYVGGAGSKTAVALTPVSLSPVKGF